ncbi:hypothetical protein HAZT_HAZT010692 [Hyalella azteca]|uniref:Amino acid transporter transmembrane domain-containing protein n=1 Tax=Hyalella azteca TaxID=294128 RepID=A0A6A0HCD3_HYAAZ|nr:hypothetical protein HAZT_HAZT010692 [Hyalella azteca]
MKITDEPGPAGHGGRVRGLGYLKTSYFIIAQMTGVGFLALPKALANSGWGGVTMILLFCLLVGFAATRLGKAWVILEERWPELRRPVRQPYMDIAEKAFGLIGRKFCFGCVIATLMGYGIAFTLLIAGMMNSLVTSVSICTWIIIISVTVCPATFLESPKDFWQASILAVVSTSLAIVIIIVQLICDQPLHPDPSYGAPTFISFSLGFSAILFAFGGASAFPTLQNDMEDRRDWWKSVIVAFSVILVLYLPIGVTGYAILGDQVPDNIILGVTEGIPVIFAIVFVIVNLLCTYVICMNPIDQAFEEILKVPNSFNWKRVVVRTCVVCFVTFVCLAVPDFGKILNLFGGSTITSLSFLFPPLMYLRLVDQKGEGKWEEK